MIQRLIHSGWGTTGGFFAGCGLVFLGERVFTSASSIALSFDIFGAAVVLVALALRAKAAFDSASNLKFADRRLLLFQLLGSLALVFYALQTEALRAQFAVLTPPETGPDTFGAIFAITAWVLWILAIIPMISLEWVSAPMRRANSCGTRRVEGALRGGLSLAAALAFLFVLNTLATRHNSHKDLAYFRSAEPGTATTQFLESLEAPINIYLYYPRANEVEEQLTTYFKALGAKSEKVRVERVDRLMSPALAKKHDISRDGTVVLAHGVRHESWIVGEELKSARKVLAKLDGEFLKRATQLTRPGRVAYLTVGHGELSDPRSGSGSAGRPDKLVREILGWKGYEIKTLSVTEGLGVKIPEDASVVLMLGARTLIFPEEQAALARYMEGGGKLILAVNPDVEEPPTQLLQALNLRFNPDVLTHDRIYLRRNHDDSDRQLLMTDGFANHPSTKTVGQHGSTLSVIFDRAGHLPQRDDGPRGQKLDFTLRTIAGTWADKNPNLRHDPDHEQRKAYNLAAAVELDGASQTDTEAGRALVFADADLFSYALLRNKGNIFTLGDGLSFLEGEEALTGTVGDEEDIPVRHSQEKDALLFHGTVFFTPLLVLFCGLGWLRLRRRRRS